MILVKKKINKKQLKKEGKIASEKVFVSLSVLKNETKNTFKIKKINDSVFLYLLINIITLPTYVKHFNAKDN